MSDIVERISLEECHARVKAQGVPREHFAFICPVCKTVQSVASLIRAGCAPEQADRVIGFDCEGRFSNSGPWPTDTNTSAEATARRFVRGCDWTLGGLFRVHRLEVTAEDVTEPLFEIATADQAKKLWDEMSPPERAA